MAVRKTSYSAADIQVLEGLEPVRKRPAMYIGGTGTTGYHHLLWENVDNSVDEVINGYASTVDVMPKYKKPAIEIILTTLHSGGKFEQGNYIHSGGLHGVGSSVVNALSKKLVATIRRDGSEWTQTFKRGVSSTKLEKVGPFRGHGTQIYFEPDPDIFKTTHFDADWIKLHLEDMSFIHQGLKITFKNEMTKEAIEFNHPGGIKEFLQK